MCVCLCVCRGLARRHKAQANWTPHMQHNPKTQARSRCQHPGLFSLLTVHTRSLMSIYSSLLTQTTNASTQLQALSRCQHLGLFPPRIPPYGVIFDRSLGLFWRICWRWHCACSKLSAPPAKHASKLVSRDVSQLEPVTTRRSSGDYSALVQEVRRTSEPTELHSASWSLAGLRV